MGKGIEEDIEKKSSVARSTTSPENLVGYQEIYLHNISDINLGENFRRKARLFAVKHNRKSLS